MLQDSRNCACCVQLTMVLWMYEDQLVEVLGT